MKTLQAALACEVFPQMSPMTDVNDKSKMIALFYQSSCPQHSTSPRTQLILLIVDTNVKSPLPAPLCPLQLSEV